MKNAREGADSRRPGVGALTLAILAAAPLTWTGGCAAVAFTGAGLIVSEEFSNNAMTATVEEDADVVWTSVKASLANMTDALIHWDDDHRAAQTRIDNAVVTVEVRNWDVGEAQLRVAAKKVLVYNAELAEMIQRRLVRDLSADVAGGMRRPEIPLEELTPAPRETAGSVEEAGWSNATWGSESGPLREGSR